MLTAPRIVTFAVLLVTLCTANAEPTILSKTGHDVIYIKNAEPGAEEMTSDQVEWAKTYGTYQSAMESASITQGGAWVGTVVSMEDGKCTETTTSIAEIPRVPGEPKMQVERKPAPCPSNQAN